MSNSEFKTTKTRNNMNFLLVTSGTGGHFYPGLALANELRQRKHTCLFCLKQKDAAIEELKSEGFSYVELPAMGLPRNLSIKLFKAIWLFVKSMALAFIHIKRHNIDCVVGFGGYVAAPVGLAARISGKRLVIHEQNALPGLASRILTFFSHRIAISFPETARYFPQNKTIITGNPVRPGITTSITYSECRRRLGLATEKFTILIFGGSQGARVLNALIPETLGVCTNKGMDTFQILHISGNVDHAKVNNEYARLAITAKVLPFLKDMGCGYGASDLVISRAGATTIWELVTVKKPAILIPYPHATGNHQLKNARSLADIGAAIVLEERSVDVEKLSALITNLYQDRAKLDNMFQAYHKLSLDPALSTSKLADVVESVVE